MTPQEIADLKKKLVSNKVSNRWANLTVADFNLGVSLLTDDQKQAIVTSISKGDHEALQVIRDFMLSILNNAATTEVEAFLAAAPDSINFIKDIT